MRIQRIINTDTEMAQNQVVDNTFITQIVQISHFLRITQLITIILSGSYLTGLAWYIYCDMTKNSSNLTEDNFIDTFALMSQPSYERVITLTYFMFTSLSTVGLGDLHPRSSLERGLGSFLLLFGVAITSYIMEHLTKMIVAIRELTKTHEEEDNLSVFFGTLERFNDEVKI